MICIFFNLEKNYMHFSCSDCGVCEGRDEEERSTGAGCDWLTLVLPYERCRVEQEGRAGYWAGPQTPKGTQIEEVFSWNALNTFSNILIRHPVTVTMPVNCTSLGGGSRKTNQFIHTVSVVTFIQELLYGKYRLLTKL